MSVEDFRINAFVRQVLARCWIDTDALRYGAIGRIVYIHGCFHKLRPAARDGDADWFGIRPELLAENMGLLERVEKEIRREPTVSDVVFRLDNFRKVNGKWTVVEGA
ncbi:MAG TPA: hypothetical protein VKU85_14570 [bacterium]|nr:hypothetical protein [bacterium]